MASYAMVAYPNANDCGAQAATSSNSSPLRNSPLAVAGFVKLALFMESDY
jgi:hypothetical protein